MPPLRRQANNYRTKGSTAVDYESMSTRDLQEECHRRGLPSARAKADLIARLTEADAAGGDGAAPAGTLPLTTEETPDPVTFTMRFPAEPEGPDEETHLAYRQTTIAAAKDAGWETAGDAWRSGMADGQQVYEVHIRRVTP